MKILYVTTIGKTMSFFGELIKDLINNGHSVDIATNERGAEVDRQYRELGCRIHQVDFSRSPLSADNIKAFIQLKKAIQNGGYDIVHCHTPNASAVTRLVCRKLRKKGTKVFYTAHGFHFYKGAPLKNWLLYYPVEKFCSRFTDVLITINREDYALAQRKMKAKRVEYVPGVGVDLHKFGTSTVDKAAKRAELGVPEDAFVLLSVGELNENKNHQIVIQAIAHMDVHYLIAGEGGERARLQHLIEELGISDRVKLLGYRRDVNELCRAADVYVLPSLREGLNLSVMEAMASFLPVACSRIRGNTDLIDENGGALFAADSVQECEEAIKRVLYGELNAAGMYNAKKVENFSIQIVCEKMRELYEI